MKPRANADPITIKKCKYFSIACIWSLPKNFDKTVWKLFVVVVFGFWDSLDGFNACLSLSSKQKSDILNDTQMLKVTN